MAVVEVDAVVGEAAAVASQDQTHRLLDEAAGSFDPTSLNFCVRVIFSEDFF